LRLTYITWRNSATIREYSGGNVSREYRIAKIAELAGADEVVGITVESFDSGASRILAGAGRLLSSLGAASLAALMRELRFTAVSCPDRVADLLAGSSLLVADHIRGLLMLSKCLGRLPEDLPVVYLAHDFYREAPYGYLPRASRGYFERSVRELLRGGAVRLIVAATLRDKYLYEEEAPGIDVVAFPSVFLPSSPLNLDRKPDDMLIINLIMNPGGIRSPPPAFVSKISELLRRNGVRFELVSVGGPAPGAAYVPNLPRDQFLQKLAEGHVGINYTSRGLPQSGVNVKRMDFAIAGNVPFSHHLSVTGEPLPREHAFIDAYDLATKISYFSPVELAEYGRENARYVAILHDRAVHSLEGALRKLVRSQTPSPISGRPASR
jgi:hypothetical protein